MSKSSSKLIVIDADVIGAATEKIHPISSACRNALLEILTVCHRVVATEETKAEWRRHTTPFAIHWLTRMAARHKYIIDVEPASLVINTAGLSTLERTIVVKDEHLLKGALAADRIIVTMDEAFKRALFKTSDRWKREIHWINPVIDPSEIFANL